MAKGRRFYSNPINVIVPATGSGLALLLPSSMRTVAVCKNMVPFHVSHLWVPSLACRTPGLIPPYVHLFFQGFATWSYSSDGILSVVLALWSKSHLILYFNLINLFHTAMVFLPRLLPFDQVFKGVFLCYRYRHWHISHMRLDRLHRLVNKQNVYTVFITTSYGSTVPLCTL